MTLDFFIPLILFAFVTSITPGPNNIMLMSSGVNFGWRRTLPHLIGVNNGFLFMLIAVGLGLGKVFETYPYLYAVLKWVSAAYFVYLAWRMVKSVAPQADTKHAKPMSYFGAFMFQWVNPKAFIMSIGYFSTYAPPDSNAFLIFIMAALFAAVGVPCLTLWTLFGDQLRDYLQTPRYLLIFNWAMAILLVASLIPIFLTI